MRYIIVICASIAVLMSITLGQQNQQKKETSDQTAVQATEKDKPAQEAKTETPAPQQKKEITAEKTAAPAAVPKTEKPAKVVEKLPVGTKDKTAGESSAEGVGVARATICTAVIDHEPQGSAVQFPKDIIKLYCFSEIKGAQNPTTILHKWYYKYQLVNSVALRIKTERWRTHSNKSISPEMVGDWKVEIVDGPTDKVLEMLTFKVE